MINSDHVFRETSLSALNAKGLQAGCTSFRRVGVTLRDIWKMGHSMNDVAIYQLSCLNCDLRITVAFSFFEFNSC